MAAIVALTMTALEGSVTRPASEACVDWARTLDADDSNRTSAIAWRMSHLEPQPIQGSTEPEVPLRFDNSFPFISPHTLVSIDAGAEPIPRHNGLFRSTCAV